jgi:hypothetical protein
MADTRRLGELVRTLRGQVPANTVAEPDGPRFFGIAEISARGRGEQRYVDPDIDLRDPIILREGDVVVALLSSIGDATVIDARNDGAVLGRECVALRITAINELLPTWLCAWMDSEEFHFQVAQHTSGSTMPRLRIQALEDFTITIPPLAQQRRIDELVRHFDSAISETATTLQQLQRLRAVELQIAMATTQEAAR